MKIYLKYTELKKIQCDKFLCSESCISSLKFISFDQLIVGSKELKLRMGVAQKKP
jgi:hypothetical protein